MVQPLYKKGSWSLWIGLAGLITINLVLSSISKSEEVGPMIITLIVAIVGIGFFITYIRGVYLILKAKGRSGWWLLLIFPLSLIGLIILFILSDKSSVVQSAPPQTSSM